MPSGEAACSVASIRAALPRTAAGVIARANDAANATGSPIPSVNPNALTTGNETKASIPKPTRLVASEHSAGLRASMPPSRRKTA